MYYSSGNYEAFARPVKPEGVEHKSAYLVGSGLAALTAACYLVRDGQMPGRNIHILEKEPIAGGACDGWHYEGLGYVMRGGREMDNHFEVMWRLSPLDPVHRDRGRVRPGRVLLAQQAGSQLLPHAGHGQPGGGRPHRRQVRPERPGRHGRS